MPNLISYVFKGLNRRINSNYLTLPSKPQCIIISPGGTGTVSIIKYLNNYITTNLHLERKYKLIGLAHLFKPPKYFSKKNVKVILIKRDVNSIYKSLKKRNFLRNSLSFYGDLFPFIYINIFKNENKLKKKFINYLKNFYKNWIGYNNLLIIDYEKIFGSFNEKKKIKDYLNIKDKNFIKNFPNKKRYKYNKDFIDPSQKTWD